MISAGRAALRGRASLRSHGSFIDKIIQVPASNLKVLFTYQFSTVTSSTGGLQGRCLARTGQAHPPLHLHQSSLLTSPQFPTAKTVLSSHHRSFQTESRRKRKSKKKKGKKKQGNDIPNPNEIEGPLGRPVLTQECYEDTLEEIGLPENQNATSVMHNAKDIMGVTMTINLNVRGPPSNPLFLATATTTFQNPEDLEPYLEFGLTSSNPHIQVNEDGGVELICMGGAYSKKKATLLASVDTLALLKEIGIDAVSNPPKFGLERKRQREKAAEKAKQHLEAEAQANYKQQLARAQMILELLNSSRPTFTLTENKVRGRNSTWVAEASLFLRGNVITAQGEPGSKKAEAEGNAVIELIKSPELETVVEEDILGTYLDLIDASPNGHVAPLHIPALEESWLEEFLQTVGTKEDRAMRVRMHSLAKEEYEFSLRERKERLEDRRQQTLGRHQQQQQSGYKERINDMLKTEEIKRQNKAVARPNGQAAKMNEIRDALPIKKIKDPLIEALKTEQVIVVSGGTGSGKSTQCPQYILEDALIGGRGSDTNIIVTQPRKIAAVSVAERVASERTEGIGHSIGYTVRFNRRAPREAGGSVEFVTTGVLLRRLINDPTLEGCSHVMIDEVHERDINTDFLLVLLRDLLMARPDLRVVLMSATLDADSFGKYFSDLNESQPVPILRVPTQPRHPVEVFNLEELVTNSTNSQVKSLAKSLLHYNDEQLRTDLEEALEEEEAGRRLAALSRAEDDGGALDSSDSECDSDGDSEDDESLVREVSRQTKERIETLKKALQIRSDEQTTKAGQSQFDPKGAAEAVVDLLCFVVQDLSEEELKEGRSGSILCFLPGWDEIKAATERLEKWQSPYSDSITILPLHSTIPHDDQKKVFEPANGKIKVILATNIAESSVTINDVISIVDTGLVREMNYNHEANMTAMETNKTSKASATQRLGRAGRVAPGKCYRLYSRGDFEAMPARPTPEIQRTALEATCLQTCSMSTKGVENFLSQALDPPKPESVALAMDRLVKLGAIEMSSDRREALSPLGHCLSRLPLDPAIGRMLIMGVVMKCLDPLLTSAACFSSRNVFYNPPGFRDTAQLIRKSFSNDSDIMAMVSAYHMFWDTVEESGWQEATDWAYEKYISVGAMVAIRAVRSQLLAELNKIGMVPPADMERRRSRKPELLKNASINENSDNAKLYSSIWQAAFPGNLAARRKMGSFGTLRTRMDSHAGLHPSSVGFHRKPPSDREERRNLPSWYLFQEQVLSSQLFLRGSSALDPQQVLLFGGYGFDPINEDAVGKRSNVRGVLDEWIAVEGRCKESVETLAIARADIIQALEYRVMHPKSELPEASQAILDCVADFLNEEEEIDEDSDQEEGGRAFSTGFSTIAHSKPNWSMFGEKIEKGEKAGSSEDPFKSIHDMLKGLKSYDEEDAFPDATTQGRR